MNKLLAVLLAASLSACASSGPLDAEAAREELMRADRAFYEATRERGLDGWVSFYGDDAARVDLFGAVARGREAIREHDAGLFADPGMELRWEPEAAGVFADGAHGFTKGGFQAVLLRDGAETVVADGAYLTIWRRRDGGGWEVILDTGAPSPDRSP